jgi:hypothetical protein
VADEVWDVPLAISYPTEFEGWPVVVPTLPVGCPQMLSQAAHREMPGWFRVRWLGGRLTPAHRTALVQMGAKAVADEGAYQAPRKSRGP